MTDSTAPPTLLWAPSPARVAQANLTDFIARVNARWNAGAPDHASVYEWSIREPERFWESLWDYASVVGDKGVAPYLVEGDRMPGAKWFPGARLNFAENLLRRRDAETAMVFWGEDKVKRQLTFGELYDLVSRLAQAMRALGIEQSGGGRVIVLARLRRAGRARPLRSDRAQGHVLRRRLPLCWQDARHARAGTRDSRAAALGAAGSRDPVPIAGAGCRRIAPCSHAG